MLASETPALDIVGAHFVRELDPGEMVVIDATGSRSVRPFAAETVEPKLCLFEFVYFARPDSRLYGQTVHSARQRMGEQLAEQAPVEADMVMGVPESGIPAAEGFARRSGIPYGQGLVKNRYIGRTFIAPSQELRDLGVRMKLNPLRENIAGKRLVVVDDSIVRGTTQRAMVRMLREAGATEVHLRISSPPYKWPCFYGMDTGDARRAARRQPRPSTRSASTSAPTRSPTSSSTASSRQPAPWAPASAPPASPATTRSRCRSSCRATPISRRSTSSTRCG